MPAPSLNRPSYVATLESLVEKLEKRIAMRSARQSTVAAVLAQADACSSTPELTGQALGPQTRPGRAQRLVSDFGFLSVSAPLSAGLLLLLTSL